MIQKGPAHQPRSEQQPSSQDRPPRTGGVKPGNEDVTIIDDRSGSQAQPREEMVTKKERKIARTIIPFFLVALAIAAVVMAMFTRRWEFLLALLVFVPYLFLISAPVWLAGASKTAHDEDAKRR